MKTLAELKEFAVAVFENHYSGYKFKLDLYTILDKIEVPDSDYGVYENPEVTAEYMWMDPETYKLFVFCDLENAEYFYGYDIPLENFPEDFQTEMLNEIYNY